ncbi:MAG TPA: hypothetical protein VF476_17730 [Chitinophagaceae bacterium]
MKRTTWLQLSLLAFLFTSCEKGFEEIERIKIEGFLLTDEYGTITGSVGNTEDDWIMFNWTRLTSLEQSFLSFPDNVGLENTSATEVRNPVAFPNPFQYQSAVYFYANDSVKLKVAIVDSHGFVWRNMATKIKGMQVLYFDFSNGDQFPSGLSLRYYYSFSAINQPNYKVGYGDIKVCRDNKDNSSCF